MASRGSRSRGGRYGTAYLDLEFIGSRGVPPVLNWRESGRRVKREEFLLRGQRTGKSIKLDGP